MFFPRRITFSHKRVLLLKFLCFPAMVSWFCNTLSLVKGYVGHRTKAVTVFMRAGSKMRMRKMRRDNISHLQNKELGKRAKLLKGR